MHEKLKLLLVRGVLLGFAYGLAGYWWKGWEVAITIFLAQLLFQVLMLFIFSQLTRDNPFHWFMGAALLIILLALIALFYLNIRYKLSILGYLPFTWA